MCKNIDKYSVVVSGEIRDRQAISGAIVCMSANLTQKFLSSPSGIVFLFRYKSEARLVLRRVAKRCGGSIIKADKLYFGAAQACVQKHS